MGRRPNAIVGDYFIRGQKLEDASNRYEHDCKKCGEHFAKGRVDGMVNHLLKKCPEMTQEDRHHVFLQMQQAPGATGAGKKRKPNGNSSTHEFVHMSMPFQQQGFAPGHQQAQLDIPVGYRQDIQSVIQPGSHHAVQSSAPSSLMLERQESALDTLAEVSRRHLDYAHGQNQQYVQDGRTQDPMLSRDSDRSMVEQALLVALQRQNSSHEQQALDDAQGTMPFFQSHEPQAVSGDDNDDVPNGFATSPLVQAATAANEQLELSSQPQVQAGLIDPQLGYRHDNNNHEPTPGSDLQQPTGYPDYLTWIEAPQTFATQQSPPSNKPNPDLGTLQKADNPNARARFSETRRQQVQDNRKRGACIRCRMLKKPCSEGTPCAACKKVDTARLWKGVCIRTRIADEFTMLSSSYFGFQAKTKRSTAVQGMICQRLPGRIEARLFGGNAFVVVFGVMRYYKNGSATSDTHQDNDSATAPTHEVVLLDSGVTDVSLQVAEYCAHNTTIDLCREQESSAFMKTTIETARSLLVVEAVRDEPREFKKARPNYIAPSMLLKQVIQLWVLATFLASSKSTDRFDLRLNNDEPPSEGLQIASSTDGVSQSTKSPLATDSRRLVQAQLLGAIENCAQRLCKTVLNELERRLLQRKQVSTFATFISAVIVLNVVERMTALYELLDLHTTPANGPAPNVDVSRTSTDPQPTEAEVTPNHPQTDQGPQTLPALWQQGPHFAKLLTLLLRLRALPPNIVRTAGNRLVVLQERSMAVRMNGIPTRPYIDEEAEKAGHWLDSMGLDYDAVTAWKNGNGAGEGWRSWDGRFIGPLLVGDGL